MASDFSIGFSLRVKEYISWIIIGIDVDKSTVAVEMAAQERIIECDKGANT